MLLLLLISSSITLLFLFIALGSGSPLANAGNAIRDTFNNIGFGVALDRLNASGETPAIVTKAGKKALEVLCKMGVRGPDGCNSGLKLKPKGMFPATACRVKFKIWFDNTFEWKQTDTHKVTGKLGGFKIGSGNASGGRYTTDGASYRLVFHKDRGAVSYFYPALKRNTTSDISWSDADQKPSLVSQSYIATGIHVFVPNRTAQLRFVSGKWNQVEMYCKLNTLGKHDGVMELVVNGQRQRLDQVRYRYTDIKIEYFHLDVFFGGGSQEYAPPRDTKIWYTDFELGSA